MSKDAKPGTPTRPSASMACDSCRRFLCTHFAAPAMAWSARPLMALGAHHRRLRLRRLRRQGATTIATGAISRSRRRFHHAHQASPRRGTEDAQLGSGKGFDGTALRAVGCCVRALARAEVQLLPLLLLLLLWWWWSLLLLLLVRLLLVAYRRRGGEGGINGVEATIVASFGRRRRI